MNRRGVSGLIKLQETKITPHFSLGIKTKQALVNKKGHPCGQPFFDNQFKLLFFNHFEQSLFSVISYVYQINTSGIVR
ncbi:hypothetical protein LBMAG25_19280 [Bacteroidota bacterium]|nr:hypothetical protein LBMAG25_19280 [Bacteroidota bacterium]